MEDEKILPETEDSTQAPEELKPLWQMQKERWYDKLPLNLKQLDTIVHLFQISPGNPENHIYHKFDRKL